MCLVFPFEITLTYNDFLLGDKYSFQKGMKKRVLNDITKPSLSLAKQDPDFSSFLLLLLSDYCSLFKIASALYVPVMF